jgi:hypothetical protein
MASTQYVIRLTGGSVKGFFIGVQRKWTDSTLFARRFETMTEAIIYAELAEDLSPTMYVIDAI